MTGVNSSATTIRLPVDIRARLDVYRTHHGMSLADVVRLAVTQLLDRNDRDKDGS